MIKQSLRAAGPWIAAGVILAAAAPAFAHPGHGDQATLAAGFIHPFAGWDHLTAMAAVGLLAWRGAGRAVALCPAGFVGGMLAGYILGQTWGAGPLIETGVAGSVVILGLLLLAVPRSLPATLTLGGCALAGLLHGAAHGTENPGGGWLFPAGLILGAAALHGLGLLLGEALRGRDGALRLAGSVVLITGITGLAFG